VLPNFFVIGAMKSGTSSLHAYLQSHPQIFMSEPKEPDYFVQVLNWGRGQEWYESLFAGSERAVARGEASTSYSMRHAWPGPAKRIASVVPEARIVYLVRDPIERMLSHYIMLRKTGKEQRPAEKAFREEPGYIRTSSYWFQLEAYLEHFPRERVFVLTSEALRHDRASTVRRVWEFLGVDATYVPEALSAERNRSTDRATRTLAGSRLKRSAALRAVTGVTPAPVRRLFGRITLKPLKVTDVPISAELRAELAALLQPQVRAIRPFLDGGFDGWGIA